MTTQVRRAATAQAEHLGVALEQVIAAGTVPTAAALVVGARRRFVTGTGKSLAYATLLAADLSVSCSHVRLIDDATLPALDVLAEVSAADVLVAYSFRRYRRETVALARAFAAAGGVVVAITDAADAPLVPLAQVSVLVDTAAPSYLDSPTAIVATSHILATLVGASAKGARRRIAARDALATELGLYLSTGGHAAPPTPPHPEET